MALTITPFNHPNWLCLEPAALLAFSKKRSMWPRSRRPLQRWRRTDINLSSGERWTGTFAVTVNGDVVNGDWPMKMTFRQQLIVWSGIVMIGLLLIGSWQPTAQEDIDTGRHHGHVHRTTPAHGQCQSVDGSAVARRGSGAAITGKPPAKYRFMPAPPLP